MRAHQRAVLPQSAGQAIAVFALTSAAFFLTVGRRGRSGGAAGVQAGANARAHLPFILGWLAAIALFLAGARR